MSDKHSPEFPSETRRRTVERHDGFYWEDSVTGETGGPFRSLAEALADSELESADEPTFEPGETLEEAQRELGIADWVDEDTGQPAEESVPRIEEH